MNRNGYASRKRLGTTGWFHQPWLLKQGLRCHLQTKDLVTEGARYKVHREQGQSCRKLAPCRKQQRTFTMPRVAEEEKPKGNASALEKLGVHYAE